MLLQVCGRVFPPNFLMEGGGGGKERFQREGACGTFNKDRDGWTLVSEQPERAVRGSVLLAALNPGYVLLSCWGRPVQGLCLEARTPPLRAGSLGEGVLKDFSCAASDFVLGFYSPSLVQPR